MVQWLSRILYPPWFWPCLASALPLPWGLDWTRCPRTGPGERQEQKSWPLLTWSLQTQHHVCLFVIAAPWWLAVHRHYCFVCLSCYCFKAMLSVTAILATIFLLSVQVTFAKLTEELSNSRLPLLITCTKDIACLFTCKDSSSKEKAFVMIIACLLYDFLVVMQNKRWLKIFWWLSWSIRSHHHHSKAFSSWMMTIWKAIKNSAKEASQKPRAFIVVVTFMSTLPSLT